MSTTSRLMTVLAMFGNPIHWPYFASDDGFNDLYLITYYQMLGQIPPEDHNYDDPKVIDGTIAMREKFRISLSRIIDKELDDFEKQQVRLAQQQAKQVKQSFRDMNKVSEHGTTAEIAEKLGVSKKQVRKWKAEGTLQQHIEAAAVC